MYRSCCTLQREEQGGTAESPKWGGATNKMGCQQVRVNQQAGLWVALEQSRYARALRFAEKHTRNSHFPTPPQMDHTHTHTNMHTDTWSAYLRCGARQDVLRLDLGGCWGHYLLSSQTEKLLFPPTHTHIIFLQLMADTYWREMTRYILVSCIHARINNKDYTNKVIYVDRRITLVLSVICDLKFSLSSMLIS